MRRLPAYAAQRARRAAWAVRERVQRQISRIRAVAARARAADAPAPPKPRPRPGPGMGM